MVQRYLPCFGELRLTLVAPPLTHNEHLRLRAALDDLLLPWSLDLSLHHELPEALRAPVARMGRLLAP